MRDPDVTRRGLDACRAALDEFGVLLVQDAHVPSATRLIVGEPLRGSWWAHELAHSIFDVLEALESEAVAVKLLAKKQTLVHEQLEPALAGLGRARDNWQMTGLSELGREALGLIDAATEPVRADELGLGVAKPATIVRDLETRLLVMTSEVHTERGRHMKAAVGWDQWALGRGFPAAAIPSGDQSRTIFEARVEHLCGDGWAKFVPWPAA